MNPTATHHEKLDACFMELADEEEALQAMKEAGATLEPLELSSDKHDIDDVSTSLEHEPYTRISCVFVVLFF